MPDVDVAAVSPRRRGIEAARFGRGHAHHAAERLEGQRNPLHVKVTSVAFQSPVVQIWIIEIFRQQPKFRNVAAPAPPFVLKVEHLYFQRIALELGPFYVNAADQRVRQRVIVLFKRVHRPIRRHLPGWFGTIKHHHVTRIDFQPWLY